MFGTPVYNQDRSWFDDSGKVIELITLTERLLPGSLSCSLQNCDAIPDLLHYLGAPRYELLRRENVSEDWLRRHQRADSNQPIPTIDTHRRMTTSTEIYDFGLP